jgi:predicted transcriptional regulator
MAILKAAPKPPKNETLQLRVEEEIKTKLGWYAEFMNSSESYVVSEALKMIFRKEDDFKTWLENHNHNDAQHQKGGSSLFEGVKK